VPGSRKRAVVGRIAGLLKLSPIARNFLFVLIDHRRIALLGAILHSFELIVDERLGFARAEVSSPRELTETQRGAINAQLERLTGKRVRMRFAVDPALIGGVVARIGSTVYDGSVRGQLQTLGRRLSTER
jgi:F-type H+-transporting ATPase subunit delta